MTGRAAGIDAPPPEQWAKLKASQRCSTARSEQKSIRWQTPLAFNTAHREDSDIEVGSKLIKADDQKWPCGYLSGNRDEHVRRPTR